MSRDGSDRLLDLVTVMLWVLGMALGAGMIATDDPVFRAMGWTLDIILGGWLFFYIFL